MNKSEAISISMMSPVINMVVAILGRELLLNGERALMIGDRP